VPSKQLQIAVILLALAVSAGVCLARSLNSIQGGGLSGPSPNLSPTVGLALPHRNQAPVSPSTPGTVPGTLSSENTGANPITGLPCSGGGALAISGAGGLADTPSAPPNESNPEQPSAELSSLTSVFGTTTSLGSC
jgi:hypothetical protein